MVWFMLRFNKKVEYAIIALMEMVKQNSSGELVTAKSLARQYQIPQEILGKVLQLLTRRGLLVSVQGVKGGYTLASSPNRISLWRVVEAVDGPTTVVPCLSADMGGCDQYDRCNIRTPMEVIQDQLQSFFSGITLSDLQTIYTDQFKNKRSYPPASIADS